MTWLWAGAAWLLAGILAATVLHRPREMDADGYEED